MRGRHVASLMLSVMLLLLVAGAGPVRGAQPAAPVEESRTAASSVANAPWFTMEEDAVENTNRGQHVSVAIDPIFGGVYVSHYDATNQRLRMAHSMWGQLGGNCGPGDSWYCQTVDSGNDVGKHSSIAAMAGGVNISNHDATNGDLKWAASTDYPYHRNWIIRTVDRGVVSSSSTGLYTSLALPQYGSPRIAYYVRNEDGDDELRLARTAGGNGNCGYDEHAGQWQCDTIVTGEGVGQYAPLAIDDDWHRHIAYYDAVSGALWYATNMSGTNCGPGESSWTCIPVSGGGGADVGRYASLAVDSEKRFHIAYYDAIDEVLKYAVDVGGSGNCGAFGSAQCEEIDLMPADYHPLGIAIALDAAGYPIIAYQAENTSLNLARPLEAVGLPPGYGNCGPEEGLFRTWLCETLDQHGQVITYRNGDYAAIATNGSGLATVAYQGFVKGSTGNLNVAWQRVQVFLPLVSRGQ